ncbi:MAG: lytic transglycosylase domain-containing protein, partial [Rhodospirillales bacterium]
WLDKYADHPQAWRLYKLALSRKPKNWRAPQRPTTGSLNGEAALTRLSIPSKNLNRAQRQKATALKRQHRRWIRNGWTKAVKRSLQEKRTRDLLSDAEYDREQARLGAAYFIHGRDDWAYAWASRAAERSGKYLPEAHWTAGLSAWRTNRFDVAAEHFEAVADADPSSSWMVTAAAFWAARTNLVNRKPEKVSKYLKIAAAYPRTFYGLLARRILGDVIAYDWSVPDLETAALKTLVDSSAGKRALSLVEAGESRRAERELGYLAARADGKLVQGILAFASRMAMPALAVRLERILFPAGGGFDGAAYPIPPWEPKEGFRVDRALIYALIRQESGFNPKAKSWAGARGLMQLMPRTASFVARDRRLHGGKRGTLYKPEFNLELGQKYIEMLLRDEKIKGDLFLLAAAWNGGPGNLNKWRRTIKHLDDPLFFIEAIPSRETRIFIERVLTNLWIYRNRLGQPMPSLDAIAAGQWPVYIPLGQGPVRVAEHDDEQYEQ